MLVPGKTFKDKCDNLLKDGICINCFEPALPKCYSDAGRREYEISGFCEKCFDELWDDVLLDYMEEK